MQIILINRKWVPDVPLKDYIWDKDHVIYEYINSWMAHTLYSVWIYRVVRTLEFHK